MKSKLFVFISAALLFGCTQTTVSNLDPVDETVCSDSSEFKHCITIAGSLEKGFTITNEWIYNNPLNTIIPGVSVAKSTWAFNLICNLDESIKHYSYPQYIYIYDTNGNKVDPSQESLTQMADGIYQNAIPKMASKLCPN